MNLPIPNPEQIDSLLKLVNREVWLITATHGGQRSGLAATWVSQVSLDRERPVLLAGLSPRNFTTELVESSGQFAAHLAPKELASIAYQLAATSGRKGDKLASVPLVDHRAGVPLIAGSRAWFVCQVFQKLVAGDRVFFWADVVEAGENHAASENAELLREQNFIQALTSEQRTHLKSLREDDSLALRPLAAAWRTAAAKK